MRDAWKPRAGNVCEASRVFAGDGAGCDASAQAERAHRLTPLLIALPPLPGMLGFPGGAALGGAGTGGSVVAKGVSR